LKLYFQKGEGLPLENEAKIYSTAYIKYRIKHRIKCDICRYRRYCDRNTISMTAASTRIMYYHTSYGRPSIYLSSFVPAYVTCYYVFYIYSAVYFSFLVK
jgi:hypothetical protein